MMKLRFGWDAVKARSNLRVHKVSFDLAQTVFDDAFAIERLDDRKDYGEKRLILVGTAKDGRVLLVVYTEREECIRIISARRATQIEERDYYAQNS